MDEIEKALKDLAKAVESNEIVASVKVTITLKKPKSNKASESTSSITTMAATNVRTLRNDLS